MNSRAMSSSVSNKNAYRNGSKPLCKYFASNICSKGQNCDFSHDRNSKPDVICRYYLQGVCTYGTNCRYDHIKPRQQNSVNKSPVTGTSNSCNTNALGNTATASKCFTQLSAGSNAFVPAANQHSAWQKPSSLNNFHQNIGFELELIGQENPINSMANNNEIALADIPLCPYFEVGLCMDNDYCRFIHGITCEMCYMNVLHPFNEAQRKNHHRECLAEREKEMEAAFANAKSAEMQCGICMEQIVACNLRFGILQNCTHCYCLTCIKKWRQHNDENFDAKTVRACPECRVHSDYVIPSKVWIDDKEEKQKLVKLFHTNTKKIQCKYVLNGDVDKCPFGNKCFYKHQLPDGDVIEGKSPNKLREERRHQFALYDFMGLTSPDDDNEIEFSFY